MPSSTRLPTTSGSSGKNAMAVKSHGAFAGHKTQHPQGQPGHSGHSGQQGRALLTPWESARALVFSKPMGTVQTSPPQQQACIFFLLAVAFAEDVPGLSE